MKTQLKFTLIFLCFLFSTNFKTKAQTPHWLWAKSVGSPVEEWVFSIAHDVSGNVYTTGYFFGTIDFDPGPGIFNLTSVANQSIFILKLDSSGNFLWAKSFGSALGDDGYSIIVDANYNVYATGFYYGTVDFDPGPGTYFLTSNGNEDIFVLKLDSSGNFIWVKGMGGQSSDVGYSITLDESGSIFTKGIFGATVDFDSGIGVFNLVSSGDEDVFITKLDSSGSFIWAESMGGTGVDVGRSISIDANYNVYTTGTFQDIADFDPGFGTFNLSSISPGLSDIFISKLDSSGNFIWAKGLGGTNSDGSTALVLDDLSNVYTSGYFYGTVDFDPGLGTFNLTPTGVNAIFILKLDSIGNFKWAKEMSGIGGGGNESWAMAIDATSNIYTTGIFGGTVDFDPSGGSFNLTAIGSNAFISKLDSSGNFVMAQNIGGTNNDLGTSISVDSAGSIYLAGEFMSPTITFDSTTLYNVSIPDDIFIAKYSQLDSTNYIVANLSCSDSSFCEKNCINFFDLSTNNPTTWQWSFPGADSATSTLQNPTNICYSAYGSFDVILIACNSFYCDTIVLTNFINEFQNPVDTIYQSNDTLYSLPAYSYQWYSTTGVISGAINQYFVLSQPGSYYCVIRDSIGCIATSNTVVVVSIIEEVSFNEQFQIYPNPNNGSFTLDFNSSVLNIGELRIFNSIGNVVYESTFTNNHQFIIPNISDGIYFIEAKTKDKV